jgi:hypothetical protein
MIRSHKKLVTVKSCSHIEEAEVQFLPFLTLALDGQLTSSPVRITPEKEQLYPLDRRVVRPQRRSERFGDKKYTLSLRGFEPQARRSVA